MFAAGAADRLEEDDLHFAAGGSLEIATVIGSLIPLGVRYQVAKRLTDDQALVHLFTLTLGR